MKGAPKGPAGRRVSVTRHGVTGTYRNPDGADTVIPPLVPEIEGENKSLAVNVCVPGVTREAVKTPSPLVSVVSAGNVADPSVLVKRTEPVQPVTVALLASRAATVNWSGTPAVAVNDDGVREKCVTAPGPVPLIARYVAFMARAVVPELRVSGFVCEALLPLTVEEAKA